MVVLKSSTSNVLGRGKTTLQKADTSSAQQAAAKMLVNTQDKNINNPRFSYFFRNYSNLFHTEKTFSYYEDANRTASLGNAFLGNGVVDLYTIALAFGGWSNGVSGEVMNILKSDKKISKLNDSILKVVFEDIENILYSKEMDKIIQSQHYNENNYDRYLGDINIIRRWMAYNNNKTNSRLKIGALVADNKYVLL